MIKHSWGLVTLLALLPLVASCESSHNENQRSVVEISSVAENGVFVSGIIDAGADREYPSDDDFMPFGHVPVTLKNRAYNDFVTAPDFSPYGHFRVTQVAVEWYATTTSTPLAQLTPFNYQANYDVVVPRDSEVTFDVMVVPLDMKQDDYFQGLIDGSTPPFSASAKIRIRGHESGAPDREIDLEGSVVVEFIGVIIGQQ